ncbi:hypothetical protein GCM10009825_04410 [Arthrobacter humicola]|uniref:Uncharacterized protein n=1 Tax=Arthrobacter humicola TaxID=409291 RepID=A0ABN2YJB8_9MICC
MGSGRRRPLRFPGSPAILRGRPGKTGVGELYRQVPAQHATSVSIGHVQDVGRFNIIGQTVTLFGTIRCTVDADMGVVQQGMRRLARHQAEAFGCTADVEFLQSVPGVINQREWIDAILPALGRIVGRERIVEVPVTLGYDDVSEFVNAYGGAYLSYGVQDIRIDGDQLRPVEGGRGLFRTTAPGFMRTTIAWLMQSGCTRASLSAISPERSPLVKEGVSGSCLP